MCMSNCTQSFKKETHQKMLSAKVGSSSVLGCAKIVVGNVGRYSNTAAALTNALAQVKKSDTVTHATDLDSLNLL